MSIQFKGDEVMGKQLLKIKASKIKSRITWGFNPTTRVIKSKKLYSRKKFNVKNLIN
jgi:hypothetical protein